MLKKEKDNFIVSSFNVNFFCFYYFGDIDPLLLLSFSQTHKVGNDVKFVNSHIVAVFFFISTNRC